MKTLLSFILVMWAFAAQAQIEKVRVKEVHDAQVLTVFDDEHREEFTMILIGMSCPGIHQPYGIEARDMVAKAVLGKTVRVEPVGVGPNEELLGVIFDENGKCLNEVLISNGLAQADERETDWLKLQEKAKTKKLGIWKDGKPVDLQKDWVEHHLKGRAKKEIKTD